MLRNTRLFEKLDAEALAYVARLTTVESYQPGNIFSRTGGARGRHGDRGRPGHHHTRDRPATYRLITLGRGALLGERLLLGSPTHVASAKALTPVRVLRRRKRVWSASNRNARTSTNSLCWSPRNHGGTARLLRCAACGNACPGGDRPVSHRAGFPGRAPHPRRNVLWHSNTARRRELPDLRRADQLRIRC